MTKRKTAAWALLALVGVAAVYSVTVSDRNSRDALTEPDVQQVPATPPDIVDALEDDVEPATQQGIVQQDNEPPPNIFDYKAEPRTNYHARLKSAGWGDPSSELVNATTTTLLEYLQQYLSGNLRHDTELIGNVCWHLAVRSAAQMDTQVTGVETRGFLRTAEFLIFSATALGDSAPIVHVGMMHLAGPGEEEVGIALARWALANFNDDSTELLHNAIETRKDSARRNGRELDQKKLQESEAIFKKLQQKFPLPHDSRAAGQEVTRA